MAAEVLNSNSVLRLSFSAKLNICASDTGHSFAHDERRAK